MPSKKRSDWHRDTLLAIQQRDATLLQTLVGLSGKNHRQHSTGLSVLMLCVIHEWPQGVDLLIALGADVNAMTKKCRADGWLTDEDRWHPLFVLLMDERVRPLMLAALLGNQAIFQKLIAHGARLDVVTYLGRSCFDCAVEGGNPDIVGQFLDQNFLPITPPAPGLSTLHYAARGGSAAVINMLLSAAEAELDYVDAEGMTPLLLALKMGHEDAALALLRGSTKARSQVNPANINSATPLQLACSHGFSRVIKELLARHADVNAPGAYGVLPLTAAARGGHLEVMATLLHAGAKVNTSGPQDQETALIAAAGQGHSAAVSLLLEHGADTALENCIGQTALELAVANDHAASLRLLLARATHLDTRRSSALWFDAAVNNAVAVLKVLKELYPPPDQPHPVTGLTPLLIAASLCKAEAVRQLLDAGADINQCSPQGKTALHLAGDCATVQVLLDAGMDINHADPQGSTALHNAVQGLDPERVQLLLLKGADVNGCCRMQTTPLVLACQEGIGHARQIGRCDGERELKTTSIVDYLLLAGADVNKANAAGTTALMFALALRSAPCVTRLLQQPELRINQASVKGTTALMCAVAAASDINFLFDSYRGDECRDIRQPNGTPDELAALLRMGADVHAANQSGWTPLVFAARAGAMALVDALRQAGANRVPESRLNDPFNTLSLIQKAGLTIILD